MKHSLEAALMVCALPLLCGQQGDKPFPAHKVVGNVYYVGSTNYSSFLVDDGEGHVLINSSFESTVPWIRASIESLGFRFQDVRILLTSHAPRDHVAGNFLVQGNRPMNPSGESPGGRA